MFIRLRGIGTLLILVGLVACSGGQRPSDGGDGGEGGAVDGIGTGDGIGGEGGTDVIGGDVVPADADDTGGGDAVSTDADPDATGTDVIATDTPMGTDVVVTDTPVGMDIVTTDTPVGMDVGPVDTGMSCPTPTRPCYSGPAGTAGTGVCRNGTQMCVSGMYGACTGEITPTAEACNGLDDNCNGTADDGLPTLSCGVGACRRTGQPSCVMGRPAMCTPGAPAANETCGNMIDDNCNGAVDEGCACTYVSTRGNDATGNGSAGAPFRTIQVGINRAGTGTPALPTTVCVAGNIGTLPHYAENVTMRNGINVYGGYMQVATGNWPRSGAASVITPSMDRGLLFDATVTMPTILDGFTVNSTSGATNAAISVMGSTGAVISNNIVMGGGGMTSHAIDITASPGGAATPMILRNAIFGGGGSLTAYGIRSRGSAPTIQQNCATLDAMGRCTSGCGAWPARGIRGRSAGPGAAAYGVHLENSPGAVVDASAVCSGSGTMDVAGVRIVGNAARTIVRASNIGAFGGGRNAVGVWAESCGGASPWIVNNTFISGNSPTLGARADGVRSVGACHCVVDSNVRIVGGVESANNDANGVLCAADSTGTASRCTVLNNVQIQGSGGGFPPNATGVRCENGSCIRIEGNQQITGQSGIRSFGVTLINTGAVVARNRIEAGCGQMEATGLRTENAYARIDDNLVFGNLCAGTIAPTGNSWGVRVFLAAGTNEIDLHSNDIFAEGPPPGSMAACTSRGISFDVGAGGAPPSGGRGVVRNNVVHPGRCATRIGIEEVSAFADPRVLENNDLWFQAAGDALYRNEGTTNITAIAMVNGLGDITSTANLSANPVFVGAPNYRLQMTSPCINSGTAAGAPTLDFYGTTRPRGAAPDMGAAEF